MNKPLVSICIPTYNNARYIGKTLQSIINQTYKNFEIIVMDNASLDNTEEIVKSFSDARIHYYKNPHTIVCLANWNKAIKLAVGKYVALYHSDDIYEPHIIEKEVMFLESHPEVGAVFCLDKIIDENGRFIKFIRNGTDLPLGLKKKDILKFNNLLNGLLRKSGSFLVAPTFMARREIFNNVGFFREDNKFGDSAGSAADMEMWLRISQKYSVGIIKERLIFRRITKTQGSTQYENSRITRANHFKVLDSFLKDVNVDRKTLRQYEFNKFWDDVKIAKNLVKQARQDEAKKLLSKIFSLKTVLVGFTNVKNFVKLVVYFSFLVFSFFGVANTIIKFLRFVRQRYA